MEMLQSNDKQKRKKTHKTSTNIYYHNMWDITVKNCKMSTVNDCKNVFLFFSKTVAPLVKLGEKRYEK